MVGEFGVGRRARLGKGKGLDSERPSSVKEVVLQCGYRARGHERHFFEIRKGFPPVLDLLTSVVSFLSSFRYCKPWTLGFALLLGTSNKGRNTYSGAYRCACRDISQSQNTMLDQENEELSPFVIPQEDIDVLNASEGFCMLRSYLARDTRYAPTSRAPQPSHPGWAATEH